MEFAWNTQKNKITDIKGLEKEQEREGKITNKEIDLERTKLNYDMVKSDLNLYQRVKKRIDAVRSNSRIQKNSVVDYSNIITVPKEQFEKWGVEKSKKYLEEVYNYFCKEFGKENVISAKVHLDETTPHMHLHFVPVNEEGKLQARKVMTPIRINKIHSEAPKYLQEKGFDVVRGSGRTEKSLKIKEFKEHKLQEEINNKISEIEKESIDLTNKLKRIKNLSDSLSKTEEHIKSTIGKLDNIKAEKTFLGSKLTLTKEEYSLLMTVAKTGEGKLLENIQLKSKVNDLQKKVNDLENKVKGKTLDDKIRDIKLNKADEFERESKKYKTAFERVERAIQNLGLVDEINKEIKKFKEYEKNIQK